MVDFHQRLKEAMNMRNITQSELCAKTGIPKSAMSQYISGAFRPKQTRTYLIAEALNVSEAWLLGYDVPMTRITPENGGGYAGVNYHLNELSDEDRFNENIAQEQKNIFAKNLNRLLSESGKSQSDLATHFGITASTVSDWCNAKKYPRVDKMQMLADYFGVKKSDLTDENTLNQSERKLILLARHLEKIPEEKRQTLISNFEYTIDMYLDALGIKKED